VIVKNQAWSQLFVDFFPESGNISFIMNIQDLLTFSDYRKDIPKAELDLSQLYENKKERLNFDDRFDKFMASNPLNGEIIELKGDFLTYNTEEIVPEQTDSRKPLLLLFGNPAPQSVKEEMFFASEGKGKEHRIWSVLKKTGFLAFSKADSINGTSHELNQARKNTLYNLDYDSPFRIGFAVFYSMPSPASDKNWSGVAGLRRLFGTKAFTRISEFEKKRVDKIIQRFITPNGAVIAFQKDAYLGIKSPPADYDVYFAKKGLLKGVCEYNPRIKIFCGPPTRLIQSEQAIKALIDIREKCILFS
jgi:hypothetical protein